LISRKRPCMKGRGLGAIEKGGEVDFRESGRREVLVDAAPEGGRYPEQARGHRRDCI